jgi:NADH dehydrogenase
MTSDPTGMREARGGVLVVGGGFAGGYVARLRGTRGATIVSPENFMLFTPMLPEAASGTLEPRHTVVPLRQMCPHAELLLGRVTSIDEERQLAHVATPDAGSFDVHYEQLVLALGAVSRTLPVPGLPEHGLAFKDLADAIHLRNRVLRELEAADADVDSGETTAHLGFVFVGAGYAGVEALAELSDLVSDALRWYPRLRGVSQRWVLVDAAPKILPEIPTRLGDYAARELARRGVEIHSLHHAELVRRRRSGALERRADSGAHARLDRGREGEPAARRVRAAARRARPRSRRLIPPRGGP